MQWLLVCCFALQAAGSLATTCPTTDCGSAGIVCSPTILHEDDRRLHERIDPVELAKSKTDLEAHFRDAPRRLAPFDGSPPSEISIASLVLPASTAFLGEAALMEAVIEEINNDPTLFPNTVVKGVVLSEGTDIKTMVDNADYAHMTAGACVTVGLTTGTRQSIMGSLAKVRSSNHGFWMDMEVGTMPRYSEFGTSFGIFGWSTIISSFLDMVSSLNPSEDRFALILPESFKPMADRFDVEQNLRGIAVVYKMIYDYRRVDVDATFDDADSYAAQIIDGVVAAKANIVFQCFCSTNNEYFRGQLFRRAIDAGLFREGFQWYTHYPSVISFKEPWLYDEEYADIWPYLDYFKVLDQGDYEPPDYSYTSNYKSDQDAAYTDAILAPKIQKYIDQYDTTLDNRSYASLNWLNCSSEEHSSFAICDTSNAPSLDSQRALKFDAIKHIAWALHEIIITNGNYDYCDISAAGVRTGDPQVFLDQLRMKEIDGYSGHRSFQPINVTGGQVLTLPPSFMLADWKPTYARLNGGYSATKECMMHVNRFAAQDAPISERVMWRDFFTGKEITEMRFLTNTTTPPNTWYHDMCGKSYRIDMDRADKKCVACPDGEFNPPSDEMDACESIEDYYCPAGTYLVQALAAGSGLTSPCMNCSLGLYSTGGASVCSLCPLGTFTNFEGTSECRSCTAALASLDLFTTTTLGASNTSFCVCPAGTYRSGLSCTSCPEGMTCPAGSDISSRDTLPRVNVGYMTIPDEPLTVYKCELEQHCPGGDPGSCDTLRDPESVACALCVDGAYEDGEECMLCEGGGSVAPFIIVGLLGVSAVAALTISVNRSALMQTDASMMLIIIVGLMITSLQVVNIYIQMEIQWFDPLTSVFEAMSIVSFDLKVVKGGCIFGSGVVSNFIARQCIGPGCLPIIWLALQGRRMKLPHSTMVGPMFLNAMGTIYQGLFIAMVLSAFGPLVCYNHPEDSGSSMVSRPEILCSFEGDHMFLVVAGVISLCIVPIPFLALTGVAIHQYPQKISQINSKTSVGWLHAFRFVFFRFKPQRYYFSLILLCRSFLVCLVPVTIRHDSAFQVCIMSAILALWVLVQQQMLPWKASWSNLLDGTMTMLLLMLLLCGSMSTAAQDMTTIRALGTLFFALLVACIGLAGAFALMSKISPRPLVGIWICHFKREADAQVHFVKTLLADKTRRRVQLDSEIESSLNEVVDWVKTRAQCIVVYYTKNCLAQPHCAAQIAAGHAVRVKLMMFISENMLMPSVDDLNQSMNFLEMASRPLNELYISMKDVKRAYDHLLSESTPCITMPGTLGSEGFHVATEILSSAVHVTESLRITSVREMPKLPDRQGLLLVSCDAEDPEALAAAGAIRYCLDRHEVKHPEKLGYSPICILADHVLDPRQRAKLIYTARSVVVLLSHGSLLSVDQLGTMTQTVTALGQDSAIPVVTPSFSFPSANYFSDMLPSLWCLDVEDSVSKIQVFLAALAVPFEATLPREAAAAIAYRAHKRGESTKLSFPEEDDSVPKPMSIPVPFQMAL